MRLKWKISMQSKVYDINSSKKQLTLRTYAVFRLNPKIVQLCVDLGTHITTNVY